MRNSEILTRFWDNTIQRFLNVPPTMNFVSPLREVNYDPLHGITNVDYSYRIGVRGSITYEMFNLGSFDVVEYQERKLREAMAERMLTDAMGLINPDMQDVVVTSRMPEMMVIHPRMYAELLGSVGTGQPLGSRWFPPNRNL